MTQSPVNPDAEMLRALSADEMPLSTAQHTRASSLQSSWPIARVGHLVYTPVSSSSTVMVTSPQSDASHDSDGGNNGAGQGKNPAPKDKECPYCHQRFTSSSLGRHLDQYIFKKRPDGIHNIEEIRQQRGGITRRTPRQGSAAKREREGSLPTRTSSIDVCGTPPASVDLLNGKVAGGVETKFNTLTWHSTGVISDLDVQKLTGQTPPVSKSTGIKRNWGAFEAGQRDSLDSKADAGGDKDTVRALELALREVLDSLQAAG